MLIEKLKITDHPAIGTIELNFCDDTGEPARTVVIAGQNGAGKTVVLEAIQSAFEEMCYFPGQIEAVVVLDDSEEDRIVHHLAQYKGGHLPNLNRKLHIVRRARTSFSIIHQEIGRGSAFGVDNGPAGLALRAFFSPANVSFAEGSPSAVSSDVLDRSGLLSSRFTTDGVGISQLLVAIDAQDASAIARYARQNRGVDPIDAVESKLDRFRNAFSFMFPHKRLCDIRAGNGTFSIVFEEGGIETSIHQLSTGEKQVVYRAGAFIRDAGVLQKALVLIDEPELSLSPDWQMKILPFYASTLSIGEAPHPQIICATHSPFIVHSASAGKVIVLQRTAGGHVEVMPEPMFPAVTSPVAVRAFNLERFVSEAAPDTMSVITEGKTDSLILKAAWVALYGGEPLPFSIQQGTGAKSLNSLLNGPGLSTLTRSGKVVVLFDFDGAWDQWSGVWKAPAAVMVRADDRAGHIKRHPELPAWTLVLPVPDFRTAIAGVRFAGRSRLSIELMFPDEAIPDHMLAREEQPGGVRLPKFRDSYKSEFAEGVDRIDAAHFAAFKPLFDRLLEVLAA